ncbi:MAG: hypothetical protein Hens3KO_17250 [Henriciella sp.]
MDLSAFLSMLRENVDVLIAVLSAIVALIGALLSRVETRRQRAVQLENLRHGVDAQSLAWGNASIDLLNRAAMFARTRQHQQNDTSFLQQRVNLMLGLSSLVERGRLFFPNIEPESKGAEKEGAYRGSRPPILDALMFAYYEVEALSRTEGPTADNSGEFIEDCRRLMVSELQAHLDPRRRDAVVGRYDDQRLEHRQEARKRALTLAALLKSRRPGLKIEGARKETLQ